MRIGVYLVLALLALTIVACAKSEVKTVQTTPTPDTGNAANVAGDASATQLEQTFDQGFQDDTSTVSDDLNPDDFVY
jgi:hypothetical protein